MDYMTSRHLNDSILSVTMAPLSGKPNLSIPIDLLLENKIELNPIFAFWIFAQNNCCSI